MQKKFSKQAKVVVIGGGTGVFTALSGLRKYPSVALAAVVSVADDGGSSGVLREEFGILPPGDIRRALVALASADNRMLADLFNYRFREGRLSGHTFGNIMLTALERITGSFESAVEEAGRLLGAAGRAIPVTLSRVRLSARLENGVVIEGETNIDIPKHDPRLKIKEVFLRPKAKANKNACSAIAAADLIVIGPGDLYTSVIPNLLITGIPEAIRKARGQKVFVTNIMTKLGETNDFSAGDFVRAVERYLGRGALDYVLVNTKRPSESRLRYYEKESAAFVEPSGLARLPVPVLGDFLRPKGFVRHDPARLAAVLVSLL